jgi:hypothetical protein
MPSNMGNSHDSDNTILNKYFEFSQIIERQEKILYL